MSRWAGRKVRRLVNATLANKGTVCHLCGLPDADSADHDPPREDLVDAGVPDPDSLYYLWPSHRIPCNISRGRRPVTPALKAELRAKREEHIGMASTVPPLSPRFAARRPVSSRQPTGPEAPDLPVSRSGSPKIGPEPNGTGP